MPVLEPLTSNTILLQLLFPAICVLLFFALYCIDRTQRNAIWLICWSVNLMADIAVLLFAMHDNLQEMTAIPLSVKAIGAYFIFIISTPLKISRAKHVWQLALLFCLVWSAAGCWLSFSPRIIAALPIGFLLAAYIAIFVKAYRMYASNTFSTLLLTIVVTLWGFLNVFGALSNPSAFYESWEYRLTDLFQFLAALFLIRNYFEKLHHPLSAANLLRTLVEKTDRVVYSYRLSANAGPNYISPGIEEITGYPAKAFYESPSLMMRITHPEDRRALMDLPQTIIAGSGQSMISRIWRKDSAMLWIEHTALPIFDENGSLKEIQGIAQDITPEKQLQSRDYLIKEVALMAMENRPLNKILAHICKQLVDIYGLNFAWIGMKEHDGSISIRAVESASPPMPRVREMNLRWDAASEGQGVAGKVIQTGQTVIVDMERDMFRLWYDRLISRKVRSVASFPLKTRGCTLGLLTIYSNYKDFFSQRIVNEIEAFGEQIALVINDAVTKQQLDLVTAGLNSTANAVIITDQDFLIQWSNRAFLELAKGEAPGIFNRPFFEVIRFPDSNANDYNKVKESILSGSIWREEAEVLINDGCQIPVELIMASVINEENIISHFIAVLHDITDRKQAEYHKLKSRETISQAEKLSSLGRMAASISHEINQPLNAIKVITDSIHYWQSKGIDTDMDELLSAIDSISQQADQIDKVIKHVRSFLHGKNGSMLAPFDLNSIIDSATSLLEKQLSTHHIDLRKNLADGLPPVLATPTGLEQIIINLVINAFHALNQIEKKNKVITISTLFDDHHIIMLVSDNGPGIAADIKSQIFEPFFSTAESDGMGLGLAIVKSIITSFHGHITEESNEFGGATFRAEFPVGNSINSGEEVS